MAQPRLREVNASQEILDFYAEPAAAMTSPGRHHAAFEHLPEDVPALARVVQGLAVHQYLADRYGFSVPEARMSESHIRRTEKLLDALFALDPQPLGVARPVERRIVGVCHHHMLLLVAMLRVKGVPARGRCGFGAYFNPPYFEDHWLCEYWNAAEQRWVFADPQFDEVWKQGPNIDHDVLDVPRDRFLVAADAWTKGRAGEADASKFGIFAGDLRGLWFIAVWRAIPRPGETLSEDQLTYFDRIAALTRDPDASFDQLRVLYKNDDRLRVPATVFNAVLQRPEAVR